MTREVTPEECPTCKGEKHPKDKYGWMKPIECRDRFHLWYCHNNYTPFGCRGHWPGNLRCMDLG